MAKSTTNSVYIATRNIMTRRRLSELETMQGTADRELWDALDESFSMDRCTKGLEAKHEDPTFKLDDYAAEMIHISYAEKLSQLDRDTLDVSVKIFLYSPSLDAISVSIYHVMKELGVDFIDTVILSKTDQVSLESHFASSWAQLEDLRKMNLLKELGVADMSFNELEQIKTIVNYAPTINQIHVDHSCNPSEDLMKFASHNNIALFSHSDSSRLITDTEFTQLLKKHDYEVTAGLSISWIIRFSVTSKTRQVIINKGYIISADDY